MTRADLRKSLFRVGLVLEVDDFVMALDRPSRLSKFMPLEVFKQRISDHYDSLSATQRLPEWKHYIIQYMVLRYDNFRFVTGDTVVEMNGHDALRTLVEAAPSDVLTRRTVPIQFQTAKTNTVPTTRRSSTERVVSTVEANNPYKRGIRDQVQCVSAAASFVILGYYAPIRGDMEGLETTAECVLSGMMAFGLFWGYWATYFLLVLRPLEQYGIENRVTTKFRKNTTQRALEKIRSDLDWCEGLDFIDSTASSPKISAENTFELLESKRTVTEFMKLYQFLNHEAKLNISMNNMKLSCTAVTNVVGTALLLALAFDYDTWTEFEEKAFVITAFLVVITTCTLFAILRSVLQINDACHAGILKDFQQLRYCVKEKLSREIQANRSTHLAALEGVLDSVTTTIEFLETNDDLTGMLCGVKVTQAHVGRLCISLLAASLSAIVRVSMQ
ncbi:hypothetical protein TeGR_g1348 [Tetraparma gracilis]|uniref:Gustatory receptor n=1 Tax=Tetraparma gracilis TaxID=2962635 RepID=A0ABQ6NCW6_9STRA|nr:hypothetical protein TeGR_g1348 [Tetraparma gracilis]